MRVFKNHGACNADPKQQGLLCHKKDPPIPKKEGCHDKETHKKAPQFPKRRALMIRRPPIPKKQGCCDKETPQKEPGCC